MGRKSKNGLLLDLLLLLMVAALYTAVGGGLERALARSVMAPVYRGAGEAVALSCAVDWNAAALENILDTLEARDVRITFAVSGRWAQENPALLKRMAATQELCTMGEEPSLDGSYHEVLADVRAGLKSIERVCGQKAAYYYSGTRHVRTSARAAKALCVTQVLCTADLLCARGGAEDITARAVGAAMPGAILLASPTAAFAEALPALLDGIEAKGLRVAAIGDAEGGTG